MRLLSWIVTLPVAVVAVLFAISNRDSVTFALWPLPFTLDAPLYLATLLALLIGFVAGGLVVWLGQHRNRRRAGIEARRSAALERELAAARVRAEVAEAALLGHAPKAPPEAGTGAQTAGLPATRPGSAPTVH